MSTRRKALLVVLIAVMSMSGSIYLKKPVSVQKNTEMEELEKFSEELTVLNKELDYKIVEADVIIEYLRKMYPPDTPTNGVKKSYHDIGYEDAWIQFVKEKDGLVQVETIESKIVILFRPQKEALSKFSVGPMAPVTIKCLDGSVNCDLDPKHTLYVKNGQVELLQWKFLRETRRLKIK